MADEVNPWMRTAFDQPKISRDAERDLLTKIRAGDRTALTALMISQFKTVFFIAKRYEGMGFDLEDLVQEGFAGLLKAIKKFNSDRGCCLRDIRVTLDNGLNHSRPDQQGAPGPTACLCAGLAVQDHENQQPSF